jgi:hypothetical protein
MGIERSKMTDAERAKLARVEELRAWKATGERYVSDQDLAQEELYARLAVEGAEAREKEQAARQAKIDAQNAAQLARANQRAQAAQDAYLQRRRFEFRGTDEQWEQMKGRILEAYLLGEDEPASSPTIRF